MKYIYQLLIIVLFSFLGELCHFLIPLPVPASIYGFALLFFCLCLRIVPLEWVADTSRYLLSIMLIAFIAPTVGIIDNWDVLRPVLLPFVVIGSFTTILIAGVAGRVTQFVMRRERGEKNDG